MDGAGAFTRTGRLWQGAGGRGGTRASAWRRQMRVWVRTRPQGPQRKSSDHPGLTGGLGGTEAFSLDYGCKA